MHAESSSVLIVDDDQMNSTGLARRLQGNGYTVSVAESGRKAIELLGDGDFDLVLLDIMMPRMSGLEVLKFLRRVDSLLDLPIIMVTAKGESEDMVEALELGANDYVTKPLDFPVVLARIRTQLALRRAVTRVMELEMKLAARNQEVEATVKVAATNERLSVRDVPAWIQQALLPSLPKELPGARFACVLKLCGPPAGSHLNVFRLDNQHLGLCVLDTSGQGSAAALLAVTISHQLERLACPLSGSRYGSLSPVQVAGHLSQHFSRAAEEKVFTFLYGILDLDTGKFRFVSAGHPGPIHLPRDAQPVRLEVVGLPVGLGAGSYHEQAVSLLPGDRLMLYIDGVTEARNADGEHFGMQRLLDTLELTRRSPLDQSLDALVDSIERWRNDTPRYHDISLLFVERTDPTNPEGVAAEPTQTHRPSSPPPGPHTVGK
jgi:sigma-B regulation protein RsbU (phosphoserine phosphatase)